MPLPLGLKNIVDERRIDWIISVAPDDLAPQLSRIVYGLLHNEARHLKEEGISFVETTILTDTFRKILEKVFEALHGNSVLTKWLNLDMGSGKTHLLALITYLLYAYDSFEELEEYHRLGLDRDIAKKAALFVSDLRTPSEILRTFFPFFRESLRRVGEEDAAHYVDACIGRGEIPEASELVRRFKRDTRLIIIVDELHHALLTYRATENERRWIRGIIEFITQLINYMRHYNRGFVILVASARRDYERLLQIESKDELILIAESLKSQLGRLEPIFETRWLSVEETRQIILGNLKAKQNVLHPMLDKFIDRIIKAESDIPQAQHLRSLIKAIAIYTKNAIDSGHSIVSPACFSEGVLDALFPEGGGIADRYRSIYGRIMDEIKNLEGVSEEIKDLTKLIVNTVFTTSVSGRPDQLIETIKAYKLGRYTLDLLPAVSEQEIMKLLDDLGFRNYPEVNKALEVLSGLPYIHSVKLGNAYFYFVVPIESVITVFNRLVEERYKLKLVDREDLVNKLITYLHTLSGRVGENAHIITVSDYSDLEEVTKRVDPNLLYIIMYTEPKLIKYLEESLKGSVTADIDNLIRGWFKENMLNDLATWLNEHQKSNVAIIVPIPKEEVLKGIAKFYAIEEAIGKIVRDYLLEYTGNSSRLPDEMRRLIEIELTEIHKIMSNRFVEALRSFIDACSQALTHIYVYECSYSAEYGIRCSVSLKDIKAAKGTVKTDVSIDQRTYRGLIDSLERFRDIGTKSLVEELVKEAKTYMNFVDDYKTAHSIISRHIAEDLKKSKRTTVSEDMNMYIYGSRILYIPPSIVGRAMSSISGDDIKKVIGEDVPIAKRVVEDKKVDFEVQVKKREDRETVTVVGRDLEKKPMDDFSKALEEIEKSERGEISLLIEFNKESKGALRSYLHTIKRYIKSIKVRSL